MNNNYFLAFLVAAATLISSAPYCCSLKILAYFGVFQAYFGGQKFVYVRIVVAAIFDFMTEEGGESRNSSPEGLRG